MKCFPGCVCITHMCCHWRFHVLVGWFMILLKLGTWILYTVFAVCEKKEIGCGMGWFMMVFLAIQNGYRYQIAHYTSLSFENAFETPQIPSTLRTFQNSSKLIDCGNIPELYGAHQLWEHFRTHRLWEHFWNLWNSSTLRTFQNPQNSSTLKTGQNSTEDGEANDKIRPHISFGFSSMGI